MLIDKSLSLQDLKEACQGPSSTREAFLSFWYVCALCSALIYQKLRKAFFPHARLMLRDALEGCAKRKREGGEVYRREELSR